AEADPHSPRERSPEGAVLVSPESPQQAAQALEEAGAFQPPPALLNLAQRFGLSRFEREILLLCAALELDTRIGHLCAAAQHNPQQTYPTFALALALFDDPAWDVLSP